jgi:hypothetical protein
MFSLRDPFVAGLKLILENLDGLFNIDLFVKQNLNMKNL